MEYEQDSKDAAMSVMLNNQEIAKAFTNIGLSAESQKGTDHILLFKTEHKGNLNLQKTFCAMSKDDLLNKNANSLAAAIFSYHKTDPGKEDEIKLLSTMKAVTAVATVQYLANKEDVENSLINGEQLELSFATIETKNGAADLSIKTSSEYKDMVDMADELIRNNEQRKKVFSESMVIAEKLIDRKAIRQRKPIVIYHPEWGEGIIGLIAGEYCERYKLPTVVFTRTHDGKLKGSARSTTEVHLKNALDCIQDKMIGYGGHAGAAGLSIEPEMFESFKAALTESCGKLKSIPKDFFYDLELDIDKIQKICDELEKFAPFGEGNPKIRFLVKGITIEKYREIRDNTGFLGEGKGMTIVGFDLAKKYEKLGYPKEIDCVGSLKESWFNGKKSYKFEIMDLDASF